MRYVYAYGYKTREAALDALDDMTANGSVSQGERPEIETYRAPNKDGATVIRYSITCQA